MGHRCWKRIFHCLDSRLFPPLRRHQFGFLINPLLLLLWFFLLSFLCAFLSFGALEFEILLPVLGKALLVGVPDGASPLGHDAHEYHHDELLIIVALLHAVEPHELLHDLLGHGLSDALHLAPDEVLADFVGGLAAVFGFYPVDDLEVLVIWLGFH